LVDVEDTRQQVINFLEKALEAARNGGEMAAVAHLAVLASETAGAPTTLLQLVREVRAKGYNAEADILMTAIDVATSADIPSAAEVHLHGIIEIHDIACEMLESEEVQPEDGEDGEIEEEPQEPAAKPVSRLN
jgi:hypothetical protein